jgi:16S rRNA processing protein RimM
MQDHQSLLILGRINGVFGVKGWIKLLSFTRPKENILDYKQLLLSRNGEWSPIEVEDKQKRGDRILLKLAGIDTPEAAHAYIGSDLAIYTDQLPELPKGEYYWHQLVGLNVFDLDGQLLGEVVDIVETGANDVLTVKAPEPDSPKILIPLLMDIFVKQVDLGNARMQVDWKVEE